MNTWKRRELTNNERLLQHHFKEVEKRTQREAAEKAARDERVKNELEDRRRMHEMRLAAFKKQADEGK